MAAVVAESVPCRPHPALAHVVQGYVGYRFDGLPAGIHFALPSPTLTFVVTIDAPLVMPELPDPAAGPGTFDLLVGGLHQWRGLIAHPGRQEGVQVDLDPLAGRALFGRPARDLTHHVVDAEEVLGPLARELHARVLECADWASRFGVLDDILSRALLDRPQELRPELAWCWRQIAAADGQVAIAELADEIGWSTRHLRNQFAGEFGLTPKTAARVARFHRARRLLDADGRRTIASIAATCGYADQAHLTRDFHQFVGCSPTQLRALDTAEMSAAG